MHKAARATIGALLTLLAVVLIAYTAGAYSETVITVKGTVYGERWTDKGEVAQVSILTVDGDELLVNDSIAGKGLFKVVDQNVKVTGAVLIDAEGKKRITVHDFEVVQN